jgi:hypothetical protein
LVHGRSGAAQSAHHASRAAAQQQRDLGEDGVLVGPEGPGGDGNEDDDRGTLKQEGNPIPGLRNNSEFIELWLRDAIDEGSGPFQAFGEEATSQDDDEERLPGGW